MTNTQVPYYQNDLFASMAHIEQLIDYILHLADTTLVLGHRNSEWTGHGPALEQDIAISNIALDLLGQARNFYQLAAELINEPPKAHPFTMPYKRLVTEDDLAYLRDAFDFKNYLITELPKGDWAFTILRQFYFSNWQYYFYLALKNSSNTLLAAIAEKSLKETTYHLKWSSEWVIRLGDGTHESQQRMLNAVNDLQYFFGELFEPAVYEITLIADHICVDLTALKPLWLEKTATILDEATLPFVEPTWWQSGGKKGLHTEHLGFLLAEMQFLQRAYPNSIW